MRNPNKSINDPEKPDDVKTNWVWYYKAVISSNKAWKAYYKTFKKK